MTTKFLRLSAAVLLLAGAPLLRAAIAPAENLLPSDTLAFFTVPDTAALRAASKTSPQMMFWNDPAMKSFHDKFMAKLTEKFLAPFEKDLGIKAEDFFTLPQGQLTFGVTVNGSNGHDDIPPGLVLLLDAKDKSDQLKTNLATLTKKWNAAGRALRTEKIRGLNFTVVPLTTNDYASILPKRTPVSEIGVEPKPVKPGEIYFTQYQSLLLAGNSAKVVEAVAARLTGGSTPTIGDDAVFASDKLSQFRDAPTYYGWFNGNKFFALLTASTDDSADSDTASMLPKMSAAKILAATGFDKLKSASFAVRQQADGSTVALHLTAPESTRAGLLKILALNSKDAGIPAFVPADATKFTRIRLDGKQTWAELQKIVANVSPQGLAGLNSVIDMANVMAQQKNPAFDLRTYLFNNLGDDIVIYQKPPTGTTLADFSSPPALYLIGVANPDQVIDAIKTLFSMSAPQDGAPAPRDFLGHKIYSIAQRAKATRGGVAPEPSYLYLSASSGYVAVSKDSGILEEYFRSADGKNKPLRETPGITEAAAHIGGTGGGLFSYENQRETMRSTFKLFKNSAAGDSALQMFPPAVRDWADFSLLPDYDTVAKYFYISVFGANANSEGLTLKIFTPRPPQLN
ncbi:MAG TPA: hypothetical protein VL863_02265 [bacterium]|nr:hypothetical protein [bacterium]